MHRNPRIERRLVQSNPRQDAMTSKQVMLTALLASTLMSMLAAGCSDTYRRPSASELQSPYDRVRIWAVAPLNNESGSLQADGLAMADHLARQLENAVNLDVLPVNRVLAAMDALKLPRIETQQQANAVMQLLGVDGLVVGNITAYEPYDPPKLGIAVELLTSERVDPIDPGDIRRLAYAATAEGVEPGESTPATYPVTRASGYYDAADPRVKLQMQAYAANRGAEQFKNESWRRYRISMDLYSEFVAYATSWRLLDAERRRLQAIAAELAEAEKTKNPSP